VQAGQQAAALACMTAFGTTDFRGDLAKVSVPLLVLHGDSDQNVPFEGSGQRTHQAIQAATCTSSQARRTAATSATPRSSTRHC
jgi:pimeloyl-ACP methyl ester carboxylesterase